MLKTSEIDYKLEPEENIIKFRNRVFKSVFSVKKELLSSATDPFVKIVTKMNEEENKISKVSKLGTPGGGSAYIPPTGSSSGALPEPSSGIGSKADREFWAKVITNSLSYATGAFPVSIALTSPISLPLEFFLSRIKNNIHEGNILISLPGGNNTLASIVVFPNIDFFDVGHVAIFTNGFNLGIFNSGGYVWDTKITIGADPEHGVHEENFNHNWTKKHDLAYVGVPYKSSWKWKNGWWENWYTWSTGYWYRETKDVDPYWLTTWEAKQQLGKPYASALKVLFAKAASPDSYICSSLAWYSIKKAYGLDVCDWYKTTTFPGGLFLSENIRIVDDTSK